MRLHLIVTLLFVSCYSPSKGIVYKEESPNCMVSKEEQTFQWKIEEVPGEAQASSQPNILEKIYIEQPDNSDRTLNSSIAVLIGKSIGILPCYCKSDDLLCKSYFKRYIVTAEGKEAGIMRFFSRSIELDEMTKNELDIVVFCHIESGIITYCGRMVSKYD